MSNQNATVVKRASIFLLFYNLEHFCIFNKCNCYTFKMFQVFQENDIEESDLQEENTVNSFPVQQPHTEKPTVTAYQSRYPTAFENLEERRDPGKPGEPRVPGEHYVDPGEKDEELPEDAVDGYSPPYQSTKFHNSINVDRFLESKAENKVEQNEEIPSEEDNEPYRPYQANLEIQRLIERTKSESEERAQSAPVEKQPKSQVNMIS